MVIASYPTNYFYLPKRRPACSRPATASTVQVIGYTQVSLQNNYTCLLLSVTSVLAEIFLGQFKTIKFTVMESSVYKDYNRSCLFLMAFISLGMILSGSLYYAFFPCELNTVTTCWQCPSSGTTRDPPTTTPAAARASPRQDPDGANKVPSMMNANSKENAVDVVEVGNGGHGCSSQSW